MFKVNNKDTRTMPSSVFIVNFEHISPFPLLFLYYFFCRLGYFKLVLAPEPDIIMTWKLDQILKRSKRNTNTSKTCKSDAKMTKDDFMYDFPNFVKN